MNKLYTSILIFVFLPVSLLAQREFQQEVNHKINVSLDETQKTLSGHITTTYINNSYDTLEFIYYHLWPNAYKDVNTKFAKQQLQLHNISFEYASDEYRGYIDFDTCYVNGEESVLREAFSGVEDIAILPLYQPLPPGDSVKIEGDFFVKIPILTSRLGWMENEFCITQWYPKPAVYDSYGWHPMSYLDMGEFYSEFGKFEVNIDLPDNYIVAATGNLVSKKELTRLEDYAELCNMVKNKCNVRSYGDSTKRKIVSYKCNNIHDFALFTSPDFAVDRELCFIESANKYVTCWAFYNKSHSKLWSEATKYIGKTINMLSENVGVYPYQNCSAVDAPIGAGGGMEYPTITVVSADNQLSLERVIVHEVIHNWFYGMLASNERDNPWIDEGFTSFYESKYFDKYYPGLGLLEESFGIDANIHKLNDLAGLFSRELAWSYLVSENIIQTASLNSEEMSPLNYFVLSYFKTVTAIYSLETYLGKNEFEYLMQGFYSKYRFKHIYPKDLKNYFYDNSIKPTKWFFNDFIETNKIPDYKICKIKKDSVFVKNNGECISPLFIQIGDSLHVIDGFTDEKKLYVENESEITIDPDFITLDLNRRNNYYRKGFLKSRRKLKLSMFNFMDNPKYAQVPFAPIVLYNSTDGWSPGLLFYTSPFPKKRVEFQIMPVWGSTTNSLIGFSKLSGYIHPKNELCREIEPFVSAKRFSVDDTKRYYRLVAGVKFKFRTDMLKTMESELLVRNVNATDYYFDSVNNFQEIKYDLSDQGPINYWSASLDLQRGYGFVKMTAEYNKFFNYNENIGLDIRVFAGAFLYSSEQYYGNYNFRMSGNLGSQDYFYDHLFVGRNVDIKMDPENLWSHQFIKNDGGFTLYTPYGQTDEWLVAVNLNSETPLRIIDVYANFGLCPIQNEYKPDFYYESGIRLKFAKDFFSIYFPITGTAKVWDTSNNIYTDNYLQKIRFTLSLDKINILNYRSKPYLLF